MKIRWFYCSVITMTLLLTSCANTTANPPVSPVKAIKLEGFLATENIHFDEFWVKPNIDLSSYTKIMVRSSGMQYQEVKQARKSKSKVYQHYDLNKEERNKLANLATREFKQEIIKVKNFVIVDTPGKNTLQLNLGLLNVSTFVPPDKVSNENIIRKTVGTAVVTLEFYDSESNELLMHGFDQIIVKKIGHESISTLGAKRWTKIRKMPAVWARGLAAKIDSTQNVTSK